MLRVVIFAFLVVTCRGLPRIASGSAKGENEVTNEAGAAATTTAPVAIDFELDLEESSSAELGAGPDEPLRPSQGNNRVMYDQRQDGQYNVRADLENFMIFINPDKGGLGVIGGGGSLFDLLRHGKLGSAKGSKLKYFLNDRAQPVATQQQKAVAQFIEGRTPYRVDLSSDAADSPDHGRVQPDRQVDVLPPPYPLSYNMMKPIHLEAEPTVFQALPPPPPGYNNARNYFRLSKSLKELPLPPSNGLQTSAPRFNAKRSPDHNPSFVYASLDGLKNVDGLEDIRARTVDLNLEDQQDSIPLTSLNNDVLSKDADGNWELKLIGATEQCGPDRKRNSYGICEFVQDY